MDKRSNEITFAKLIYDLMGGNGLFNIFADILSRTLKNDEKATDEYKDECKKYTDCIRNNIENYMIITDSKVKKDIFIQFLVSKIISNYDTDDRYKMIWQFERRKLI